MFIGMIQIWVARYMSRGNDMTDVRAIQKELANDLREDVPLNLVNAAIHAVKQVRGKS